MRKILFVLCAVLMLAVTSQAWDKTYTAVVDCSSYPVVNSDQFTVDISSNISKIRITRIAISNSDNATAQTVSFYDNATSTTAANASALLEVELADESTQPVVWLDFSDRLPLVAENGLIIRKSVPGTDVKVTVVYW